MRIFKNSEWTTRSGFRACTGKVLGKTSQVPCSRALGICKITALRFGRKLMVLGGAAAAVCAGLVIETSEAYARPEPPSGANCPSGYFAAKANKSFYGIALPAGRDKTSSTNVQDEIVGLACFKRSSPTHGTLQYRWGAVGRLQEGIFSYQLYDCTARRILRQHWKTLQYPNGSGSTHGRGRAEVALNPKHKYAVRVTGGGVYERPHVVPGLAAVGHFGPYPRDRGGGGKPRFFDQAPCQ
jgi:hypothetical protein